MKKPKVLLSFVCITCVLFLSCFSGCVDSPPSVSAIECDLQAASMLIEPIDTPDPRGVKARLRYTNGRQGSYVEVADHSDFTFSYIKENGKYTVCVKHKSGAEYWYDVLIKTITSLILLDLPERTVFSTAEKVFDLKGMTVRLRYSDGSVSREIAVKGNSLFTVSASLRQSYQGTVVVSCGTADIDIPAVFLAGFDKASGIVRISNVGMVTGPASVNASILSENELLYTDLGISAYDKDRRLQYFFYGDTFSSLTPDGYGFAGTWRSNFYAFSGDTDYSDGVTFDGVGAPVIEGNHQENRADLNGEVTKIPTGAVVVNDTVYMFYMSISDWADWRIRWSGCVKLVNGKWENVPSLNWADVSALSFIDNHPSFDEPQFDYVPVPNDRFKQITVCANEPNGEYLYLYATGNGRVTDARLMRVQPSDFENIQRYEYYCGMKNGDPLWKRADENGVADSVAVIDKASTSRSVGELTVTYNPYLEKYMATYCADNYQSGYSNQYFGCLMRLSRTPYGPFDEIYCIDKYGAMQARGGIYGAFTNEGMMEEDGKIVYIQVSSFTPTYGTQLLRVEFAKRDEA